MPYICISQRTRDIQVIKIMDSNCLPSVITSWNDIVEWTESAQTVSTITVRAVVTTELKLEEKEKKLEKTGW